MNYRALALVPFVFAVSTACKEGATPPPEPQSPPAASAPTPSVEPAPSAEPLVAPSAEAPPVASAVPIASAEPPAPAASAAPSKAGKPASTAAAKPAATPAPAPEKTAEAAPAAGLEDPCTTKTFHYTQLASACKAGGRKAAKNFMKSVVNKAKAAGTDLKCTSCHADMSSFALKGNAVTDLKQWL